MGWPALLILGWPALVILASGAGAVAPYPAGLVRVVATPDTPSFDFVPNASNINSAQAKAVVATGVDSAYVKQLGATSSAAACARRCAAAPWCRSFSRYADGYANASLRTRCYGHADYVWLPLSKASVDAGLLERPCGDDLDCSLNGECLTPAPAEAGLPSAYCACSAGWAGKRCERLDLAPVDGAVLGFDPVEDGRNMSSWGGGVVEIGGAFHLYASELVNHCGIDSYILNSGVVHAVAADLAGPYVRRDSLLPPFAHEPVVALAPTGELVVVAVAGPLDAAFPSCVCETGRTVKGCGCGGIPGNECHPQEPTLLWASDPNGPWLRRPLFPDKTRGENPSVWIAANGSAYGMSRGGHISAFALDWRNASCWTHGVAGARPLAGGPDVEDPFIYQDGRDRFHALLHNLEGPHMGADPMLVGTHAFSEDGLVWHYGGLAYTNVVSLTSNASLVLNRRERPHLALDKNRTPLALVTSAEVRGAANGDRSFTLVQTLRAQS